MAASLPLQGFAALRQNGLQRQAGGRDSPGITREVMPDRLVAKVDLCRGGPRVQEGPEDPLKCPQVP